MTILLLFLEFFKIGCFSFGGGFGMLPLMEETVLSHGWLTRDRFYDFVGICESTPGPIAVNMATYVGSSQAGLWGSLAATLGVVLPSFLVILLIAAILKNFAGNPYVNGFVRGVKPVITGLILSTGVILLLNVTSLFPQKTVNLPAAVIFVAVTAAAVIYRKVRKKKLPAAAIILLAACMGIGFTFY